MEVELRGELTSWDGERERGRRELRALSLLLWISFLESSEYRMCHGVPEVYRRTTFERRRKMYSKLSKLSKTSAICYLSSEWLLTRE